MNTPQVADGVTSRGTVSRHLSRYTAPEPGILVSSICELEGGVVG